jgi:tRNA (mo5U34)-methyltransferase
VSAPFWYHVVELPDGPTPGWFDLRPIVDRMPWPDVRGRRCLDVGTYDGFLAFELERRGAAEVVATDIPDHASWDWPIALRETGPQYQAQWTGERKGAGFEVARAALGSRARREAVSVYDLDPAVHGTFDVVVCGSLMLHLQDPVRALERIRAVCGGVFLSAETIELSTSVVRRPLARIRGDELCQWYVPNAAGHRRMVEAAGFQVLRETRPYAIPFGPAHPPRGREPGELARSLGTRLACGNDGVPHHAVLAQPV